MSNSMWFPPLNSPRHESHTYVNISQNVHGSNICPPNGPMFVVKFKADADFESDYGPKEPMLKSFRGLRVNDSFHFSWDRLSSAEFITSEVYKRSSFRFDGDITWAERHFGEGCWTSCELFESGEVFEKIQNFLCVMMEKAHNADKKSIQVDLSISKEVTVPRHELELWNSWYEEEKQSDPRFESEFGQAIGRPRREEEETWEQFLMRCRRRSIELEEVGRTEEEQMKKKRLMELKEAGRAEEVQKRKKKSEQEFCCICLEDFSKDSQLRKLACDHIFDHDCIYKWLQQANTCPVCRYEMEKNE